MLCFCLTMLNHVKAPCLICFPLKICLFSQGGAAQRRVRPARDAEVDGTGKGRASGERGAEEAGHEGR